MDKQIEELKELVRRNIALSEETRSMVESMQRSARLSRLVRVLWWGLIFGASGIAYYYFVWPYVEQLQRLYESAQQGGQQAQDFGKAVVDFFSQFIPGK